ncbi:MAG: hypothetical protein NVSMB17_00530 [Candidatus Dormibacteria bacterium]
MNLDNSAPVKRADVPEGVERRDRDARAARDRLGDWLRVEPLKLREVEREPVETMVVLTDAFEVAARRVLEQEQRLSDLAERLDILEAMVRTDPLTGIANRRGVQERLEMEWRRAARHGHDLSIIALDCDRLGQVNEAFGYAAGDAVLREVAERLQRVLRAGDLVGRVGGDDFLVVCPHTDHEGAALAARKIVAQVKCALVEGQGPMRDVHVTVSAGWSHNVGQPDWHQLVRDAEEALLRARSTRAS